MTYPSPTNGGKGHTSLWHSAGRRRATASPCAEVVFRGTMFRQVSHPFNVAAETIGENITGCSHGTCEEIGKCCGVDRYSPFVHILLTRLRLLSAIPRCISVFTAVHGHVKVGLLSKLNAYDGQRANLASTEVQPLWNRLTKAMIVSAIRRYMRCRDFQPLISFSDR